MGKNRTADDVAGNAMNRQDEKKKHEGVMMQQKTKIPHITYQPVIGMTHKAADHPGTWFQHYNGKWFRTRGERVNIAATIRY